VIAEDLAEFLRQHRVTDTVIADRIIGCPHEEGVDYPMGRACPQCPFWTGIDRFTHEAIRRPMPTLSPTDVLATLSRTRSDQPLAALESADAHREALVGPLVSAIERGLVDPAAATPEEATLFCYALYQLAKWRETKAYPLVIRWLSLPGEGAFDIAGDVVTQDGSRILAAVCDGDLEPVKTLVLNRDVNEFCRGAALTALELLGAWGEVPLESIVTHFLWLAREGLEREASQVWNALANAAVDIEALPVFPDLRRAYDDGLIDEQSIQRSELDALEAAPRGHQLERTRERDAPIDDVAAATAWWGAFANGRASRTTMQPCKAPPKVGRNEPCPCGSGKKYKKCCGA
jgi:Protein of unknown function (DUF1186)/SEC-C motif